jgi:predicted transposase/invertase (TIGR01784 family)
VIEAYDEIERFNWTKEQYDAYVRVWMEIDREKCAMEQKYADGEAKGRTDANAENARKMLDDGLSTDKIALYTGLSLAEIEKLRAL